MNDFSRATIGLLCLAPAFTASAETIETILVAKQRFFVQSSATSVVPSTSGLLTNAPFDFTCSVGGVDLAGLKPPPRVGGPFANLINDGVMGYDPFEMDVWRYGAPDVATVAGSQASLDAQYPNGTYEIEVLDAVVPLAITGDLYPTAAPRLTLQGGVWRPDGSYLIREDAVLSITTSGFPEFGTNVLDFILIELFGASTFISSENFSWKSSSNVGTLDVPSDTLPGGSTFLIDALFISCAEVNVEIPELPDTLAAAFYGSGTRVVLKVSPRSDLDKNGVVNALDLASLLASWGPCAGCDADLNADGTVSALDLAKLLAEWS